MLIVLNLCGTVSQMQWYADVNSASAFYYSGRVPLLHSFLNSCCQCGPILYGDEHLYEDSALYYYVLLALIH